MEFQEFRFFAAVPHRIHSSSTIFSIIIQANIVLNIQGAQHRMIIFRRKRLLSDPKTQKQAQTIAQLFARVLACARSGYINYKLNGSDICCWDANGFPVSAFGMMRITFIRNGAPCHSITEEQK